MAVVMIQLVFINLYHCYVFARRPHNGPVSMTDLPVAIKIPFNVKSVHRERISKTPHPNRAQILPFLAHAFNKWEVRKDADGVLRAHASLPSACCRSSKEKKMSKHNFLSLEWKRVSGETGQPFGFDRFCS